MNCAITAEAPEPASIAEGCRNPFGRCSRLDPDTGDGDYYEPHEPNLEEAGLPWFHFIAAPIDIVDNLRDQYIEESEALWGKEHWLRQEL